MARSTMSIAQSRSPYYPDQQILANKQVRWWWNNPHYAVPLSMGEGALSFGSIIRKIGRATRGIAAHES